MCEFCEGKSFPVSVKPNKSVKLEFSNLGGTAIGIGVVQYGLHTSWFNINYCPMCGEYVRKVNCSIVGVKWGYCVWCKKQTYRKNKIGNFCCEECETNNKRQN